MVHLLVEGLLFPVGSDAEKQWWEVNPQVHCRLNGIRLVFELGQNKQNQGVREIVGEWQVAADPSPDEKLTIGQIVRLVEEVPQQNENSNVDTEADEDEEVSIPFQSAWLAGQPSVACCDSMWASWNKETSQEDGRDEGVRTEPTQEQSLRKNEHGERYNIRWPSLA